MMRDLDIDVEEQIDSNFIESIKEVTSKALLDKIKYPNPLHTFKFNRVLTNLEVNKARFMMEGIGFPAKYWLCTGPKTLHQVMAYNIEDEHYNELIKVSKRKDVLCLHGLPLFYATEHSLGDCLLLVSDISRVVRTICFMINDVEEDSQYKEAMKAYVKPKKNKPTKKKPKKSSYDDDDDDDDDDYGL